MPFALRSIELMRETDQAMAAYTHMLEGRLLLGSSLTIGEYVLPRLLAPFGKAYPNISVMLKIMNTTQIMEEITKHQLNFGLIEAEVTHPDMVIEPVMEDELKLIVPGDHELAGRSEVPLEEVLRYPFVLRERLGNTPGYGGSNCWPEGWTWVSCRLLWSLAVRERSNRRWKRGWA